MEEKLKVIKAAKAVALQFIKGENTSDSPFPDVNGKVHLDRPKIMSNKIIGTYCDNLTIKSQFSDLLMFQYI